MSVKRGLSHKNTTMKVDVAVFWYKCVLIGNIRIRKFGSTLTVGTDLSTCSV